MPNPLSAEPPIRFGTTAARAAITLPPTSRVAISPFEGVNVGKAACQASASSPAHDRSSSAASSGWAAR